MSHNCSAYSIKKRSIYVEKVTLKYAIFKKDAFIRKIINNLRTMCIDIQIHFLKFAVI